MQLGQVVTVVRVGARARWRHVVVPVLLALVGLTTPGTGHATSTHERPAALMLVTFDSSGTSGYRGSLDAGEYRTLLDSRQDAVLATVDAPDPVYRWTTALSGVAVELTPQQATELRDHPWVVAVEENAVRPLAAARPPAAPPLAPTGRGGAGVVIAVVDTGIWPESPLFADSPAQEPRPDRFARSCGPAEDWPPGTCSDKLVAAHWYVAGFGEERVAADEPLSARDVRGHGTQVASIAAGNAGVPLVAPGLRGGFSGVAPRAGIAAYKACWSAPDPDDDGCATADLVAAIDRATRDGVDVLNLSVAGAPGIDSVERALLGAAEAGTVVVAAAGNDRGDGYATHVSPWVTTVGAVTGPALTGAVELRPRRRLPGVMTARERVSARVVSGEEIPAPGWSPRDAAVCAPGSLDAARAAGRIVVCERGTIGRTAKSEAVDRSEGVGMVLVNVRPGPPTHDLHAVPTVHLGQDAGQTLTAWLRGHPRARITLAPTRSHPGPPRIAPWSPGGDPTASFVKPDLVAPGTAVLGAVPPSVSGSRWAFLSGTSSAAAWTSGAAAALLAHRDWSAPVVRSVLATSGRPVGGSALETGAGLPRIADARQARLAHAVRPGDYRAWLSGRLDDLNTPSLLFHGVGTSTRRLTNVGGRPDTWRASVSGFERYDVTVSPAAVTLGPGRSARYRVTVSGGSVAGGLDEGTITWRAPDGSAVRVPVAVGR